MMSEDLIVELGSLIRRLERRVRSDGMLAHDDAQAITIDGIERALIGLIRMHMEVSGNG